MSWDTVVNVASTAWKIIQDGKPSADIDRHTCNAVPQVSDWTSLQGAQGPNWIRRKLKYTNGFGFDVVDLKVELRWEYGARYNNGGAFIPNCWISVPTCDVLWGYDVDLNMYVHNPTNSGTSAAPIARLPVTVSGTVSTPFWSDTVSWEYVLFGNGDYQM